MGPPVLAAVVFMGGRGHSLTRSTNLLLSAARVKFKKWAGRKAREIPALHLPTECVSVYCHYRIGFEPDNKVGGSAIMKWDSGQTPVTSGLLRDVGLFPPSSGSHCVGGGQKNVFFILRACLCHEAEIIKLVAH